MQNLPAPLQQQQQQQQQQQGRPAPHQTNERPWDSLGPPSNPLQFEEPIFEKGIRARIVCYPPAGVEQGSEYERLDNVLLRDYSETGEWGQLEYAYYPVPGRAGMRASAGYVQQCHILRRCPAPSDAPARLVFEYTPRYAAVKVCFRSEILRLQQEQEAEDPFKEVAVMQALGDAVPHVSVCKEALYDPGNDSYNVVMPYYGGGDIFARLQQSRPDGRNGMDENQARRFTQDVLQGLRGLNDRGICHHDLSVENVMLDGDQAYIIDFGMAVRIPYQATSNQRCLVHPMGAFGKLPYMSPEIFEDRDPFDGEAIDVWSVGIILFCMVTGNASYRFPHVTDPQYYWMTRDLNQLLTMDWGLDLTPECLDLLENMLQVDPRLRLTVDEVLEHPWFQII